LATRQLTTVADRETELQIGFSKSLIERSKRELELLLRQIEESQKTIERSRKIIASWMR
jgi:hypothetical protein